MNQFSVASDEIALLNSEDSSKSLIIAPTSHTNIGRFFNSPCKQKSLNSCLPKEANMESLRICIDEQVRILLKTTLDVEKGTHLVWNYNYK